MVSTPIFEGTDPTATFITHLESYRDAEPDAARRKLLELFVRHVRLEMIDHDIDALMKTMIETPSIRNYGLPSGKRVDGADAVRDEFLMAFSVGYGATGMILERLAVSDDSIFMEGDLVIKGALAKSIAADAGGAIDDSRACTVTKHVCSVIWFDDDLIGGHTVFFDGPFTAAEVRYLSS